MSVEKAQMVSWEATHWFLIWFSFITWWSSQFWVWGSERWFITHEIAWSYMEKLFLVSTFSPPAVASLWPPEGGETSRTTSCPNLPYCPYSDKLSMIGWQDVPWVLQRTIRSMELTNLYPTLAEVQSMEHFARESVAEDLVVFLW